MNEFSAFDFNLKSSHPSASTSTVNRSYGGFYVWFVVFFCVVVAVVSFLCSSFLWGDRSLCEYICARSMANPPNIFSSWSRYRGTYMLCALHTHRERDKKHTEHSEQICLKLPVALGFMLFFHAMSCAVCCARCCYYFFPIHSLVSSLFHTELASTPNVRWDFEM